MKKIYSLIILSILTLVSCNQDEFLDKDPYDQVTTENLFKDLETFKAAVSGAYNSFQDTYYYNSYFTMLPDVMSDNVQAIYTVFTDIDKYETTSTNADAKRVWDKMSLAIAQTSIVIRQAESLDFGSDQEEATQLIGQMYVARALAYFDMQRMFAQPYNFTPDASHLGIPLVDESQVGIELISPARNTTAEVYAKIVADIQKGITLIGDETPSVYLLNKNSAKALLARVYLYMENWVDANDMATEVIGSGYTLVSNSNYVASWTAESSTESIFSIVNTVTDNSSTSSMVYYYGRPRFNATTDLFNALDAGDVRKSLIVSKKVLKYPAYATRDNNIPVIRLSEMYLIKAEALAEMNMDEDARDAVNEIRLRANLLATPYSESGDELKDMIQDERRKELMFEGHRLFDLTRKKKSFTKYSTTSGIPIAIDYPNNLTILPIPQAEIDANDNISESQQNPGY
ncbi:MAG: RagB/SusD family nutrient uptake outer membrane protein [Flavobacteriaceae bacterium]|nr:RagB/SusD family nutrient uptake outer membrane protein [Flavobacteriaceae bacterium]